MTHANPTQIRNIKKEMEGEVDKPSVENQAIEMFGEGKRPIEVTIALQISPEETLQYYGQYQRLIGVEEIPRIVDILGNELVPFVDYFKEMRSNFSLENIKEASRIAWNMDEAITSLAIIQVEKEHELKAVEKLFELRKGLESLNIQGNLPPAVLGNTRY